MNERDRQSEDERPGLIIGPTEGASDVQLSGRARSGPVRSDDAIRTRIEERIAASSLAGSPVEVEVRSGTVVLRGEVSGPTARHMAEQIAESVGGVRAVRNELQTRDPEQGTAGRYTRPA